MIFPSRLQPLFTEILMSPFTPSLWMEKPLVIGSKLIFFYAFRNYNVAKWFHVHAAENSKLSVSSIAGSRSFASIRYCHVQYQSVAFISSIFIRHITIISFSRRWANGCVRRNWVFERRIRFIRVKCHLLRTWSI